MAKKNKSKANKNLASNSTDSPLAHNPFGALSGVQGSSSKKSDSLVFPEKQIAPVIIAKPPAYRFSKKVVVRREKKGRRGKTVTVIAGIPRTELKDITSAMKKAMGCGASIEDDLLVVLQGDLVKRAMEWLRKAGATQIVSGT